MKIICPDCQAAYEVRLPETSQKDVKVKCARCKSKFLVQQTSRDAALPEKMVGSPGPNIKSLGRDKSFDDFIPDRDEGSGDLAQSRQDSPFDTEENLDDYLDQLFDEKIEDSPPASPAPQPDSPELELAQDNLPSDDFLEDLFDEIIQKDLGKQTKDNPSEEDLSLPSTVSEEINGDNLDDFFDEIIREEFNEPSGETAGKNREPGTTSTAVEDSLQDAGPASPKKEIDPPKPPVPPAKETAQTEEAAGESAIVENQGENGSDALTEGNPGETSLSPESENSPAADTPPAHPEAGDATHGEEAASAEMDPATPDSHVSEKGMDESGGPVSQTPTPPLEKDPEPPQVPEEEKPSTAETSGDKEPANILAKAGDTQDSADPKEAPAEGKSGEKSDDDLWAEAFADQENLEQAATEKDTEEESAALPKEAPAEGKSGEKSDDDLWAEAFADQENLEQTATEKDTEEESAALPKEAPAEGESREKNDDDLWAEAFADQENLEQAATEKDTEEESAAATDEEGPAEETDATGEDQPSPEDEDETAEEDAEEDENAREEQDEAPEDQDGHEDEEEAWKKELEEQYADDYDEEEFQFKKKKFGPFTLPATKTGKIILAGSVAAVLLTGGGAYFALQTLAPPELVKMGKTPSEVPDGLKPNAGQESAASTDPAAGPAPADQPPAPESNAVKEPNSSPEPSGSGKPPGDELLAKADEGPREGLVAALSPKNKSVELSTIMPVAYNVNDIRVLSFQLEMEMSDEDSAEIVRGALPVFEKITVRTVEQVLERKFFNDILYVKEKLQKKLQKNYNKVIEGGGKVKKIKFKEFEIQ